MTLVLLALHGYTLNGSVMRAQLAPLAPSLPEVVCLDAPHRCSEASVRRMFPDGPGHAPPYLTWWDASDDGAVYEGWVATKELLAAWLISTASAGGKIGVIGFSQGAMVAATVAALSARGDLPPIHFAIFVAGSVPRAHALAPLFEPPIPVPSLHVWGLRDNVSGATAPALAERFSSEGREIATWRGPHVIPESGSAASAIVEFVRRYA